jgi:hypothetical protein
MPPMKFKTLFIVTVMIALLLTSCGQKEQDFDVAAALTQTAAAQPLAEAPAVISATPTGPIITGVISGRVHLFAPPTPPMTVYALDPANGLWASTTTPLSEGEATFSLTVQQGTYILFAHSEDPATPAYAGYPNTDDTDLGLVTVAAGQTVTDIVIRPPAPFDCGQMWGLPPSPDGRFVSISASDSCIATQAANLPYVPVARDVCKMIQETANSVLATSFVMEPNTPFDFIWTGESGTACTLTASGTGMDFNDPSNIVRDLISAMPGWEENPNYSANGAAGESVTLTRDMAVMVISAGWEPAPEANCLADQPISACSLSPDQKQYTVKIELAQK